MVLLIDNYDSFTFNLAQYLGELGAEVTVRRNDQITLDEIAALAPSRIVISPGPGRPEDAGVSIPVIQRFGASLPILGVCLGHQAMGAAFGGNVVRAPRLMHGKSSTVGHDGKPHNLSDHSFAVTFWAAAAVMFVAFLLAAYYARAYAPEYRGEDDAVPAGGA